MGGRSLLLYAKAMVNVYTVHIRMSRVEVRIQEKGGVGLARIFGCGSLFTRVLFWAYALRLYASG